MSKTVNQFEHYGEVDVEALNAVATTLNFPAVAEMFMTACNEGMEEIRKQMEAKGWSPVKNDPEHAPRIEVRFTAWGEK